MHGMQVALRIFAIGKQRQQVSTPVFAPPQSLPLGGNGKTAFVPPLGKEEPSRQKQWGNYIKAIEQTIAQLPKNQQGRWTAELTALLLESADHRPSKAWHFLSRLKNSISPANSRKRNQAQALPQRSPAPPPKKGGAKTNGNGKEPQRGPSLPLHLFCSRSRREVIAGLQREGWTIEERKRHTLAFREGCGQQMTFRRHRKEATDPVLLRNQFKRAGVSEAEAEKIFGIR